jgi:hypothetical protein
MDIPNVSHPWGPQTSGLPEGSEAIFAKSSHGAPAHGALGGGTRSVSPNARVVIAVDPTQQPATAAHTTSHLLGLTRMSIPSRIDANRAIRAPFHALLSKVIPVDGSGSLCRIAGWLGIVAAFALAPPAGADPTPYVKLPSTICQADVDSVACQGIFPDAPVDPCIGPKCPEVMHMDQAVIDPAGNFKWRDANIGLPGADREGWLIVGAGQTYRVNGWTAQRDDGDTTTFTNDATGHGMAMEVLADKGPMGETQTRVRAF